MRVALLALLLAGCAAMPPVPAPQPRYVVGEPYRLGGQWSYPTEDLALVEQGVAAMMPALRGLTVNGEAFIGMAAAHRTLQLPAIVTVTNLENGRSLRLRINHRGPDAPGRFLGVTARAAALLGANGPFQARLVVEAEASRAAIAGLAGQAAPLAIAAAPMGRVEREALAPPPGARAAPGIAAVRTVIAEAPQAPSPPPPAVLPEDLRQDQAKPGRLHLEAGIFFRRDLAAAQAARLGFRSEAVGPPGRQQRFRVRAGPYATLTEADAAFARALASGQQELRLVVE